MKLARKQVPSIAKAIIARLIGDQDVEIRDTMREESELDVAAILVEWANNEDALDRETQNALTRRGLSLERFEMVKAELARTHAHPQGAAAIEKLAEQMASELMSSRHVDEVFADDEELRAKIQRILTQSLAPKPGAPAASAANGGSESTS